MKAEHSRKKKSLILVLICVILFILFAAYSVRYNYLSNMLTSQMAGQNWKGKNKKNFIQNTIFFPSDGRIKEGDIEFFRIEADRRLKEASISEEKGIKQWVDAYSAQSEVDVVSEHNSLSLNAFGVGGEYFFFHPLLLRSGAYITQGDLSRNQIVLDVKAAWGLFGATDVKGMNVKISGKQFVVAGVVENEDDAFSNITKSDKGQIYLHYSAFYDICNVDINTYEIVLPEPIKGFAFNVVNDGFPLESKEIVTNSSRFTVTRILKKAFDINNMIIQSKGIAFPYFENAARILEYRLIRILWVMMSLLIVFILGLLFIAIRIIHLHKKNISIGRVIKDGKYYFEKYKEGLRQKCRCYRWFKFGDKR